MQRKKVNVKNFLSTQDNKNSMKFSILYQYYELRNLIFIKYSICNKWNICTMCIYLLNIFIYYIKEIIIIFQLNFAKYRAKVAQWNIYISNLADKNYFCSLFTTLIFFKLLNIIKNRIINKFKLFEKYKYRKYIFHL